jgi:hypothetical protein
MHFNDDESLFRRAITAKCSDEAKCLKRKSAATTAVHDSVDTPLPDQASHDDENSNDAN